MNTDTLRSIEAIKDNGYYREGLSLGAGGWLAVYSLTSDWGSYYLINLDDNTVEPACKITARDDEAAIKAFASLFALGEFAHEVYRVETKHTLILEQL